MKLARLVTSTAGLVAVAALSIGVAQANQIEFNDNSFQNGRGGEFEVSFLDTAGQALLDTSSDSSGTGLDGYFQTFCLEKDEYLNFTDRYGFTLSTEADAGGINTNSGDPLGGATAWLYTEFWNGTLTGYNWSGNRNESAGELQEAIWFLEDEIDSTDGQAASWVDLAQDAGWTDTGNVRVLVLSDNGRYNDGTHAQDVLAMVDPVSVPATPLPLLFWSGLLLLGGGIVISRRRKLQGSAFRDSDLAV